MAVIKQVGESINYGSGAPVYTIRYWGLESEIDAYILANPKGDTLSGYGEISNIVRIGLEGGAAEVIYTCVKSGTTTGEDDEDEEPLTTVWSLTNTRIEVPIEAFCGGDDPNFVQIKMWRDEPDDVLKAQKKYLSPTGVLRDLNTHAKTAKMADMILHGVEVAVRYYPCMTRTTTYSKSPKYIGNIGRIDTPSTGSSLAAAWLKIVEDTSQNYDGSWTRTESWQGADSYYTELYGTNAQRWSLGG